MPILDYAVVIYKKDVTLIGKLDEERFQPSNNLSIWVQAQQKIALHFELKRPEFWSMTFARMRIKKI